MNNHTVRDAIAKAIAGNTPLDTWCQFNFGKPVTVFDGIDHMKLPDPGDSAAGENGDYPFVALDIPEKNQGNMQEGETIEVSVFCALLDESPYETVEQNIKRLPGIDKRDQFRVLVLTALVGAEVSGGVITHVDTVNLPVEYSPEFAAAMAVTIERPYAFRENRFE